MKEDTFKTDLYRLDRKQDPFARNDQPGDVAARFGIFLISHQVERFFVGYGTYRIEGLQRGGYFGVGTVNPQSQFKNVFDRRRKFLDTVFGDDPTIVNDDDAVADCADVGQDMCRQKDCPVFTEFPDKALEF